MTTIKFKTQEVHLETGQELSIRNNEDYRGDISIARKERFC